MSMHSARTDLLAQDAVVNDLLQPLLAAAADLPDVTEICVNRPGVVLVFSQGRFVHVAVPALTFEWGMSLARAIAVYSDQQVDAMSPILSAMLPGGERIQIVVPPTAPPGTVSLTIRVPSSVVKTLSEWEADGMFHRYRWAKHPDYDARRRELSPLDAALCDHLENNRLRQFLELAVRESKFIAAVGATGSGKTSLLKALIACIPLEERLGSIEDVRELIFPHENVVSLVYSRGGQGVARVTPSDLIACLMRQFPSRGILGETRGSEAFDLLKLLTTGHTGMTSWHAESCALAIERFVGMCKEHPDAAIYATDELRRLVALTMDIIVHVVARPTFDATGKVVGRERYVAEVHFDPIAKLAAQFGGGQVHTARPADVVPIHGGGGR